MPSPGRTPIFTDKPYVGYGQITVANTNRDGTGTTVEIARGGSVGSRINMVQWQAVGTTTAGMLRLFLSLDNGTTKRLIAEIPVTAITASASVAGAFGSWFFNAGSNGEPLYLPDANAVLYASTHNAETFNLIASGGQY
jgi:hypothetical protein